VLAGVINLFEQRHNVSLLPCMTWVRLGLYFCVCALPCACAPFTHIGEGSTVKVVSRPHQIVALGLICLCIGSPALACLPNSQMTAAEMECCKKMAGDCNMGKGQHPCCKTVSPTPSPVASVQPSLHFHPSFAVAALTVTLEVAPVSTGEFAQVNLGLPPPAPPGPNSILRI